MRFGPWKIPKCLGNGTRGDQRWVQSGWKTQFSKSNPRLCGNSKQVILAIFSPWCRVLGHGNSKNALKMGRFGTEECTQNWATFCVLKSNPPPLTMLNQLFLAHFEPVVTHFGPWKIPKCLENVTVWDHKWVKNGSTTCFSKSDCGQFGVRKQVFLAHFEPLATRFSPWKIPKCVEYGPFCTKSGSKMGHKLVFEN